MRRALLVGAGTAVGLIATLSYAPAEGALTLASDAETLEADGLGGPAATDPGTAAETDPAAGDESGTGTPTDATDAGSDPATDPAVQPAADPASDPATAAGDPAPAGGEAPAGQGAAPAPRASTSAPATAAKPSPKPTGAQPAPTTAKPTPKPTTAKPTPAPTTAKPTPAPTTAKPTPTPTPTAQDFTGTAVTHRYGTVQVAIRVLDGRIIDAWAVQYPTKGDSKDISAKSIPKLRASTLSTQSASIATVSGATLTSNAWKTSLQNALGQAGL
jgi:uncharacterized protein with FMN-binding domain